MGIGMSLISPEKYRRNEIVIAVEYAVLFREARSG